ncbi:ferrochelatase [Herpetosiphon gulosus]|uniref:Ferrochelatase n=1 Tax=Herpetosiphon gulosus TaxID=1973496 RepID=A0ABP9WWV2_9CHLR
MSAKTAVLLMAYGTPNRIDEVEQYYINVRGGRMPTPEQVENLSARYRAVGGHTPLTTLTKSVTEQLQAQLDAEFPDQYQVYFGMKYWHPLIPDVVKQIHADGISKVIGLALAPHYSKISIGGYQKQVDRANEEFTTNIELTMINSWQEQPKFRNLIANRISEALAQFPADVRDQVTVLFSAHSLPQRVLAWGDPYPDELLGSAKGIAEMLELPDWRFTYQSQGETGEPWLGPDVLDTLAELAAEGKKYVLQVPFGFVCDHLEILYDIDIEGKHKANELGLQLERIRLLNDDPAFVDLLKTVVTGQ